MFTYPFVGVTVTVLIFWAAWFIYRDLGKKERELSQQGFHIEWVSPGVLRDGPDDIAFVYHDLRGEIWFPGKLEKGKSVVTFPDDLAWEKKVPDWAKYERKIIIERIRKAH